MFDLSGNRQTWILFALTLAIVTCVMYGSTPDLLQGTDDYLLWGTNLTFYHYQVFLPISLPLCFLHSHFTVLVRLSKSVSWARFCFYVTLRILERRIGLPASGILVLEIDAENEYAQKGLQQLSP